MFSEIIQTLGTSELENIDSSTQFAVEHQLSPSDLKIDIDGIGVLDVPIQKAAIQKMLEKATLANFGLREQTLQDTKIRNTYEISADQINVTCNEKIINEMLEKMRRSFGLPDHVFLTAALHNLLIYKPGQFFKPHQDSEKLQGMIATLVIILPSAHIGGDLIIYHKKAEHCFVSEHLHSNRLKCVAFYANCQHEVKPVRQGYRVAVTYNIVLNAQQKHQLDHQYQNTLLEKALQQYFLMKKKLSPDYPVVFPYFLDHEYSQQGLLWEMLKGVDFKHACAFLNAAKALNLKPHLALVKVHTSWATEPYTDDREPCELLEDTAVLDYWIDQDNTPLSYGSYNLSEDDFCWTKDTKTLSPYATEYTGWMGNDGNTIEFWYRRAAIILWDETDQIKMEFILGYDMALKKLMQLTKESAQEKQVLSIIEEVGEHIHGTYQPLDANNLLIFMKLASYIKDESIATKILQVFNLTILDISHIEMLLTLQAAYDVDWCLDLLQGWHDKKGRHDFYGNDKLLSSFDHLIAHAVNIHLNERLIKFLIDYHYKMLLNKNEFSLTQSPKERMLSSKERSQEALALLRSCCLIDSADVLSKTWVTYLISNKDLYDLPSLASIYCLLCENSPSSHSKIGHLLHDYLSQSIAEELKQGLRGPKDWAIDVRIGCQCEYCNVVDNFLRAKNESEKIYPMAQAHRSHVSDVIDNMGIPVTLKTVKKGSPHQLVIRKTDALFEIAKKRFDLLSRYANQLATGDIG